MVGEPGFIIGGIRPDESTSYSISVTTPGTYGIAIRAASGASGGTAEVQLDGAAIAAPTALGSTGGWWAFESTDLGTVNLSAGAHTVDVFWGAGQSNFDRLDFVLLDEAFACRVSAGSVSWTDDGQSKYWIYRSTDGGASWSWLGRTLGATSFVDTRPVVGVKYQVHYAGIPRVECTIDAEPVLAGDTFACAINPTTGVIVWTDAGQSKYWIYRSVDGVTYTWLGRTVGSTAFADVNPPTGATYQVHYAGYPRTNCSTQVGSVNPTPVPPTATPVPPRPTPVPPTATPVPPTPTPEPDCGSAAQQAEDGALAGNMRILNDSRAVGGQFVGAPAVGADEPALNLAHRAEFCVDVLHAGTYFIDARVLTPDDDSTSFWVGVDDEPPVLWAIDATRNVWVDDVVSGGEGADPAGFALNPGQHLVRF